jgi:hypothetical protein
VLRAAGWVVGSSLVGLCAVLVFVRESDNSLAYRLGASLGAIVFGIGIAALVALLVVKTSGHGRVLSPWMALGAGVLALLGLSASGAREHDKTLNAIRDTVARGSTNCPSDEPPVYAPLERGLRYGRLDPTQARALGELLSGQGHAGYSVRRILEQGVTIAGVISVPVAESELPDFRAGVRDQLRDQFGQPRTFTRRIGRDLVASVATYPAAAGQEDDVTYVLARSGCRIYLISALGAGEAIFITKGVLGTARTG